MANPSPFLKFVSVTQVAGVAEAWHDVLVLVQSLVDGSAPDGGLVVREGLLDVLDAFRGSQDASHVDVLRVALGEDRLQTHLHADAGGKHRVGDDERLAVNLRCGKIFDVDTHLGVALVGIFTISTHKGVARVIENAEKAFVERKSGTEDGANDNLVGREIDLCYTKWCSHVFCFIIESL